MSSTLFVSVVFWFNLFVAQTHIQNALISKSINTTTVVGETIEFECLGFIKPLQSNSSEFEWFKNSEFLEVEKYYKRVSLVGHGEILKITNVEMKDEGSYVCSTSNQYQCVYSMFNLTVIESEEKKLYNYLHANITRHVGENVQWSCHFFVERANINDLRYTWFKNDEPLRTSKNDTHIILSEDDESLIIKNITFDDTGNYDCVATNRSVTSYKNSTLIVVDKPKKLTYNWYTSYIKPLIGVNLQLRCDILQSTRYYKTSFLWKKNDKSLILAGSNNHMHFNYNHAILELLNITSKEKGTYECKAENDYHKIYSVFTLDVVEPEFPKIYFSSMSTTSVLVNDSVALHCYVRGVPPPKISWLKNGKLLNKFDFNERVVLQEYKQKLLFRFTKFEDDGKYECISTNSMGFTTENFNLRIKSERDEKYQINLLNEQSYSIPNILIIFTVSLLGVILTMCCVLSLLRERTLKKKLEAHKLHFFNGGIEKWNAELSIEEQTDLLPYDKRWEFSRNKLILGQQLGSGAFGVVYKAEAIGIKNGATSTTVAVKMARPNSDSFHTIALISELKIMIHIGTHLNIVNVLGACTENIVNSNTNIEKFT